MTGLMRRLFRNTPRDIDTLRWQGVRKRARLIASLDGDRDGRLQALTARFLQRKTITPLSGLQLDDDDRTLLAALCCLPLLEFGAEGLHGWSQLLVYPDAFRVNRSHVDAAGVLHEWEDELIGESWDSGPLVLSWADILADLEEPDSGYCVAVHEMAHKLDVLDGTLDGTPPLPRDWQARWAQDFQAAYDTLVEDVDAERDGLIDPYAAEAPEEFFAVCSEYHFSDPARLREALPAVAAHLQRLYGPSPMDRIAD